MIGAKARELLVRIRAQAEGFQKTQQDVNKATRGMGDAAKREQGRVSKALGAIGGAFGRVAKRIGQIGLATIVGGIAVSLKKGWDRLTGIENARASLEGLGHSASEVDSIMKAALGSVKGTSFGMDEAASTAATMVAATGKQGKDLERVMSIVADAAVIGKTSMGDMGQVFGKVAGGISAMGTQGRVTTEVMNMLRDRGIGGFKILADHLGVTQAKVQEMVTKGEIDFETFAAAMEGTMGGAAKNAGNTVQGALSNIGAALGRVGANVLQGAFSKLPELFQGFIDWLGPLEEKAQVLGEKLGVWLTNSIDSLKAGFDRISPVLGTLKAGFSELWGSLGGVVDRVREATGSIEVDVWGGLRDVIGQVASALFDASEWLDRNADSIANAVTWVKENKQVVLGLVGAYLTFRATLVAVNTARDALAWWKSTEALRGLTKEVLKNTGSWVKNRAVNVKSVALGTARGVRTVVTWLGKQTAALAVSTAGWVKSTAIKAKDMAITVAHKTAMIASAVATKAVAAAQRVLNAVMRANPIGLIITGVLLLVAGLVKLYRENETFRRIVQAVWGAVKGAVLAVVDWFRNTALPWLKNAASAIGTYFVALKDTTVRIFNQVKSGIQTAIDWIVKIFLNFTGPGLLIKHWDTIKRTFSAGATAVQNFVSGMVSRVVGFFTSLRDGVTSRATNAKDWVVARFQWLRDGVVNRATEAKDWVISRFDALATGIRNAATNAKDWFGTQFDKIKSKAKTPVEFVVNTVYNKGIAKLWNTVAGKFKLPTLPQLSFDRGGWTGPGNTHDEAGVVHADEFVVKKASRKRFEDRFPGLLHHINNTGTLPGYAGGGVVQPVPGRGNRHRSGYPWATWAGDYPQPMGTPVRAWKDGVVSTVNRWGYSYGHHVRMNHTDGSSSLYAHLSRINTFVGQLLKAGQVLGLVGSTGNSTGPHLHFESMGAAYRGGSVMSGSAKATRAFSSITDIFGSTLDKLKGIEGESGWGKLVAAVPRGIASAAWDKAKNLMHTDELTANGTLRYDNGGFLPPGFSLTENRTGRPEPVFTADQWELLEKALLGGGTGDIYISLDGREYKKIAREEARVEIRRSKKAGAGL